MQEMRCFKDPVVLHGSCWCSMTWQCTMCISTTVAMHSPPLAAVAICQIDSVITLSINARCLLLVLSALLIKLFVLEVSVLLLTLGINTEVLS